MRIVVPPGVFAPRSDSWQLARAVADAVSPGGCTLDLCTGSGVVAVSAARAGAREAWATDVSPRAVWTARLNGALHGVRVRGRAGHLFDPLGGRRFDIISANPPYLPGDSPPSTPTALARAVDGGPDGRAVLDQIIAAAPRHLRPGGRLFLIHSSVCGIDITLEQLEAVGLESRIVQQTTGPLGPLLQQRAADLEQAGLLQRESREEVMAVICATLGDGPGFAGDQAGSPSREG